MLAAKESDMTGFFNSRRLTGIRILVLALGFLLLGMGLWRDETLFVLRRAILICMGCIGIG
jgi:hypothetical protein